MQNVWVPYLAFSKQRKLEIATKGVVDRGEEGRGRGGEGQEKWHLLTFPYQLPPCPLLPKSDMAARQTIASL